MHSHKKPHHILARSKRIYILAIHPPPVSARPLEFVLKVLHKLPYEISTRAELLVILHLHYLPDRFVEPTTLIRMLSHASIASATSENPLHMI